MKRPEFSALIPVQGKFCSSFFASEWYEEFSRETLMDWLPILNSSHEPFSITSATTKLCVVYPQSCARRELGVKYKKYHSEEVPSIRALQKHSSNFYSCHSTLTHIGKNYSDTLIVWLFQDLQKQCKIFDCILMYDCSRFKCLTTCPRASHVTQWWRHWVGSPTNSRCSVPNTNTPSPILTRSKWMVEITNGSMGRRRR